MRNTPLVLAILITMATGCGSDSTSSPDGSPVADAGSPQSVLEGDTVVLDGSRSHDADGTITAYTWQQSAGPTVALNKASSAAATLQVPELSQAVSYTFSLTVTDNQGNEDSATTTITAAPAQTRIFTDKGIVEGESLADGITAFRGIPFAAPPVGELRWRAPTPAASWDDVRTTRQFAPACMQPEQEEALGASTPETMSEDCLYLNVWTPETHKDARRPVMVWIHGGSNLTGSAAQPVYDGQFLAREGDVVMVSVQYRLGVMGYFAHPLLSAETTDAVSGNYGTRDIIAALTWVRDNIHQFGGDPDNVTVFGESAGAVNTCILLASPLATGLLDGAIMQSGACADNMRDLRVSQLPLFAAAEDVGTAASATLGCADASDELACLRALNSQQLDDTLKPTGALFGDVEGEQFGPITDGVVLPAPPLSVIEQGTHNRVPVILGSNANEAGFWLLAINRLITSLNAYERVVEMLFDGDDDTVLNGPAVDVLDAYPASNRSEARVAFQRLFTDAFFTCPGRREARIFQRQQTPVWRYEFTQLTPGLEYLGAFHAAELPYVFGTLGSNKAAAEHLVSQHLMRYWTQFATSGDPNHPDVTYWPGYTETADEHLQIGTPVQTGTGLRKAYCDLLDEVS